MKKKRDTYKYDVKLGKQVIHRGITKDLERRGAEHKARWPKSRITQVGRRTTHEKALEWQRSRGRR